MRSSINSSSTGFKAGLLAVALTLASALNITAPLTAHASATGCSAGNPIMDPSLYCVTISGSGTYVNYVSGTFRGGAVICDYYITAEFFRTNWSWYQTYTSQRTWGCANGDGKSIGIYAYKQAGFMCSTLHYRVPTIGNRAMSVCHQVN